jgi:hypothetical protein
MHNALIQRYAEIESKIGDKTIDTYGLEGLLNLMRNPYEYYRIEPLYRALLMIVEVEGLERHMDFATLAEQEVRLVRTGISSGLSAPISFEQFGNTTAQQDVVTVRLEASIKFVLGLEDRERMAFPRTRDQRVLDNRLGSGGVWGFYGYSGPDFVGPSESWIKGRDVAQELYVRKLKYECTGESYWPSISSLDGPCNYP